MINSLKETELGDVILTTNDSILSRTIRWFGKLQTKYADYSHASLGLGGRMLIESRLRVRVNNVKKYEKKNCEVFRLPLDEEDKTNLRRGILQLAGDSYGITKLGLFAADSVASFTVRLFGRKKPVFWFTKNFNVFSIKVCSQLVVYGLHKFTKIKLKNRDGLKVDWRVISPDYLQDLLNIPHNGAKRVYKYMKNGG